MAGYLGPSPVPQATQTRQTFIATAAQTSFPTAGYQAGYIDVFLNGVKLVDGTDYTATNGSDVVLTVGAAVSDTLEVVAYTAFEVLDQTFTGTTTTDVLNVTGAFTSLGIDDNATSTAITIDSSENVGIGTAAPTNTLHLAGNASTPSLRLSSASSPTFYWDIGRENLTSGDFVFNSAAGGSATERMRIDSSGHAIIPAGVTLGTAVGVYSAANTLDDYEEGTFTPTIEFGGASVGLTYALQGGYYTKVGQSVTFSCYFVLSTKGTSAGTAVIKGLPFASYISAASHTAVSLRPTNISFADMMTGYITVSASQVQLTEITNAGTGSNLDNTNFINSSNLMIAGSYTTAS